MKNLFSSELVNSNLNQNDPICAFKIISEKNQNHDLLNQVLLFELKTEIPGAQTWRIDRAGSAHALELREPFLDYELVEYASSIPANYKIKHSGNKIQKKIYFTKIGRKISCLKKIVHRKKFPWGIPYYDFFINEFLPLAECLIDKSIKSS